MKLQRLILAFAVAIGVTMAADSPLIGKWKLNPAKSQFAGATYTYEQLPSGEMQMTAEGQSYKFKIDGKEYPAMWGSTASWKQIDPSTWQTTIKQGTMTSTDTIKISADGKTMTYVSKGKKPNGENFEESATLERTLPRGVDLRTNGAPSLAGQWKSTKVQTTSEMWEISANGDDGLTMKIVDYDAVCSVKFDGKDYPCTGPTMPKNFMMSAKKTGARSAEFTEKMDGKAVSHDVFTVSADGKTLTDDATTAATNEKGKAVYDRQ